MDKKEKKARKEKLGEYMDVSGSRLKDDEIEKLEYLVNNRDDLDGAQKTYSKSYRDFDSEDTYRVNESDTYSFHSDDSGIHIDNDWERKWDDGQTDEEHHEYSSARDILNSVAKIFNDLGKLGE